MMYNLTKKDFDTVFEFAVKYHLDPAKTSSTRTSGASRGLGGVLDSFIRGKLIELGVINILKTFDSNKDYILDFDIKKVNEASKEPDIIEVIEKNSARKPKVFVEIKNVGLNDRWVGLTKEQFDTSVKHNKKGKVYIVGASIQNTEKDKSAKEKDFLGSYLKEETKLDVLKSFSDLKNSFIKLEYAISSDNLKKYGILFRKDDYFYETEVFKETGTVDRKKVLNGSFASMGKIKNSNLQIYKASNSYPAPSVFGKFEVFGDMELFEKKNRSSTRRFLYCRSSVKIENQILGEFNLTKDTVYSFNPVALGRNPVLDRNNIWIAKRNVSCLEQKGNIKPALETLQEIADEI